MKWGWIFTISIIVLILIAVLLYFYYFQKSVEGFQQSATSIPLISFATLPTGTTGGTYTIFDPTAAYVQANIAQIEYPQQAATIVTKDQPLISSYFMNNFSGFQKDNTAIWSQIQYLHAAYYFYVSEYFPSTQPGTGYCPNNTCVGGARGESFIRNYLYPDGNFMTANPYGSWSYTNGDNYYSKSFLNFYTQQIYNYYASAANIFKNHPIGYIISDSERPGLSTSDVSLLQQQIGVLDLRTVTLQNFRQVTGSTINIAGIVNLVGINQQQLTQSLLDNNGGNNYTKNGDIDSITSTNTPLYSKITSAPAGILCAYPIDIDKVKRYDNGNLHNYGASLVLSWNNITTTTCTYQQSIQPYINAAISTNILTNSSWTPTSKITTTNAGAIIRDFINSKSTTGSNMTSKTVTVVGSMSPLNIAEINTSITYAMYFNFSDTSTAQRQIRISTSPSVGSLVMSNNFKGMEELVIVQANSTYTIKLDTAVQSFNTTNCNIPMSPWQQVGTLSTKPDNTSTKVGSTDILKYLPYHTSDYIRRWAVPRLGRIKSFFDDACSLTPTVSTSPGASMCALYNDVNNVNNFKRTFQEPYTKPYLNLLSVPPTAPTVLQTRTTGQLAVTADLFKRKEYTIYNYTTGPSPSKAPGWSLVIQVAQDLTFLQVTNDSVTGDPTTVSIVTFVDETTPSNIIRAQIYSYDPSLGLLTLFAIPSSLPPWIPASGTKNAVPKYYYVTKTLLSNTPNVNIDTVSSFDTIPLTLAPTVGGDATIVFNSDPGTKFITTGSTIHVVGVSFTSSFDAITTSYNSSSLTLQVRSISNIIGTFPPTATVYSVSLGNPSASSVSTVLSPTPVKDGNGTIVFPSEPGIFIANAVRTSANFYTTNSLPIIISTSGYRFNAITTTYNSDTLTLSYDTISNISGSFPTGAAIYTVSINTPTSSRYYLTSDEKKRIMDKIAQIYYQKGPSNPLISKIIDVFQVGDSIFDVRFQEIQGDPTAVRKLKDDIRSLQSDYNKYLGYTMTSEELVNMQASYFATLKAYNTALDQALTKTASGCGISARYVRIEIPSTIATPFKVSQVQVINSSGINIALYATPTVYSTKLYSYENAVSQVSYDTTNTQIKSLGTTNSMTPSNTTNTNGRLTKRFNLTTGTLPAGANALTYPSGLTVFFVSTSSSPPPGFTGVIVSFDFTTLEMVLDVTSSGDLSKQPASQYALSVNMGYLSAIQMAFLMNKEILLTRNITITDGTYVPRYAPFIYESDSKTTLSTPGVNTDSNVYVGYGNYTPTTPQTTGTLQTTGTVLAKAPIPTAPSGQTSKSMEFIELDLGSEDYIVMVRIIGEGGATQPTYQVTLKDTNGQPVSIPTGSTTLLPQNPANTTTFINSSTSPVKPTSSEDYTNAQYVDFRTNTLDSNNVSCPTSLIQQYKVARFYASFDSSYSGGSMDGYINFTGYSPDVNAALTFDPKYNGGFIVNTQSPNGNMNYTPYVIFDKNTLDASNNIVQNVANFSNASCSNPTVLKQVMNDYQASIGSPDFVKMIRQTMPTGDGIVSGYIADRFFYYPTEIKRCGFIAGPPPSLAIQWSESVIDKSTNTPQGSRQLYGTFVYSINQGNYQAADVYINFNSSSVYQYTSGAGPTGMAPLQNVITMSTPIPSETTLDNAGGGCPTTNCSDPKVIHSIVNMYNNYGVSTDGTTCPIGATGPTGATGSGPPTNQILKIVKASTPNANQCDYLAYMSNGPTGPTGIRFCGVTVDAATCSYKGVFIKTPGNVNIVEKTPYLTKLYTYAYEYIKPYAAGMNTVIGDLTNILSGPTGSTSKGLLNPKNPKSLVSAQRTYVQDTYGAYGQIQTLGSMDSGTRCSDPTVQYEFINAWKKKNRGVRQLLKVLGAGTASHTECDYLVSTADSVTAANLKTEINRVWMKQQNPNEYYFTVDTGHTDTNYINGFITNVESSFTVQQIEFMNLQTTLTGNLTEVPTAGGTISVINVPSKSGFLFIKGNPITLYNPNNPNVSAVGTIQSYTDKTNVNNIILPPSIQVTIITTNIIDTTIKYNLQLSNNTNPTVMNQDSPWASSITMGSGTLTSQTSTTATFQTTVTSIAVGDVISIYDQNNDSARATGTVTASNANIVTMTTGSASTLLPTTRAIFIQNPPPTYSAATTVTSVPNVDYINCSSTYVTTAVAQTGLTQASGNTCKKGSSQYVFTATSSSETLINSSGSTPTLPTIIAYTAPTTFPTQIAGYNVYAFQSTSSTNTYDMKVINSDTQEFGSTYKRITFYSESGVPGVRTLVPSTHPSPFSFLRITTISTGGSPAAVPLNQVTTPWTANMNILTLMQLFRNYWNNSKSTLKRVVGKGIAYATDNSIDTVYLQAPAGEFGPRGPIDVRDYRPNQWFAIQFRKTTSVNPNVFVYSAEYSTVSPTPIVFTDPYNIPNTLNPSGTAKYPDVPNDPASEYTIQSQEVSIKTYNYYNYLQFTNTASTPIELTRFYVYKIISPGTAAPIDITSSAISVSGIYPPQYALYTSTQTCDTAHYNAEPTPDILKNPDDSTVQLSYGICTLTSAQAEAQTYNKLPSTPCGIGYDTDVSGSKCRANAKFYQLVTQQTSANPMTPRLTLQSQQTIKFEFSDLLQINAFSFITGATNDSGGRSLLPTSWLVEGSIDGVTYFPRHVQNGFSYSGVPNIQNGNTSFFQPYIFPFDQLLANIPVTQSGFYTNADPKSINFKESFTNPIHPAPLVKRQAIIDRLSPQPQIRLHDSYTLPLHTKNVKITPYEQVESRRRIRTLRFRTLETAEPASKFVNMSALRFYTADATVLPTTLSNPMGSRKNGREGPDALLYDTSRRWVDYNKQPLLMNIESADPIQTYQFFVPAIAGSQDAVPVRWVLEGSYDGRIWETLHEMSEPAVFENGMTQRFSLKKQI
jgi:hypothetical protein